MNSAAVPTFNYERDALACGADIVPQMRGIASAKQRLVPENRPS